MATEIIETQETAPVAQHPQNSLMPVLEKALANPSADMSIIEKMLDAQERMMTKQAEIDFNQAMSRLQPKMPMIGKASKGHNTKYAKYEEIEEKIRPLYTAEGFSISYNSKRTDQGTLYIGKLSHVGGHHQTAEMLLPADTSGSKNAIQAVGSTMTYARRYLLCMLLNVITCNEDFDGYKREQAAGFEDMLQGAINEIAACGQKETMRAAATQEYKTLKTQGAPQEILEKLTQFVESRKKHFAESEAVNA